MPPPPDPAALADRIQAWRESDTTGYDTAIDLLCEAEAVLRAAADSRAEGMLDLGQAMIVDLAAQAEAMASMTRVGRAQAQVLIDQLQTIARLEAAQALLLTALPDSATAGSDGTGYQWAWDELTGDEQEWVKAIRQRVRDLTAASSRSS